MTARSLLAAALVLGLSLLGTACLPDAVGPSRRPPSTPTPPVTGSHSPSGPTAIPSFVRPTPTPMPTFLAYTVARGDSLTSIARRFATTARSIALWNRAIYPSLDPDSEAYAPNQIRVGWTLVLIPGLVVDEFELPQPSPAPTAGPSA